MFPEKRLWMSPFGRVTEVSGRRRVTLQDFPREDAACSLSGTELKHNNHALGESTRTCFSWPPWHLAYSKSCLSSDLSQPPSCHFHRFLFLWLLLILEILWDLNSLLFSFTLLRRSHLFPWLSGHSYVDDGQIFTLTQISGLSSDLDSKCTLGISSWALYKLNLSKIELMTFS